MEANKINTTTGYIHANNVSLSHFSAALSISRATILDRLLIMIFPSWSTVASVFLIT